MNTTLVVMAAGIGSRFGGGIKQLEPVGPNGEIIMDYSIFDARRAGFNKTIFIIRKDIEKDFEAAIGRRIKDVMDVEYAFQDINDIPEEFSVENETADGFLKDRKKPWGTGQAVLTLYGKVKDPILVINADDYYGREGFAAVHEYMVSHMKTDAKAYDMCMGGFILKNTLSDNGGVTRGVCKVDKESCLLDVTETYDISCLNGIMHAKDEAGNSKAVEADQYVSMNMWGLPPSFLEELKKEFPLFLKGLKAGDVKSEFLLPSIIDKCIKTGRGTVKVLPTKDRWFGVTYKQDKDSVTASIRKLIEDGIYPEKLYDGKA